MNISSAQPNCSITSSDTITLNSTPTTGSYIYTIDNNGTTSVTSGQTITFSNTAGYSLNGATISIGPITTSGSGYTWEGPKEFVNAFPDFARVEKMCETYPGLKIAYEKFVNTYRLVKDDYDNPNIKK